MTLIEERELLLTRVKKYFKYLQSYILAGNLFQLLIQVIMISGAASFVSECGRGWMSVALRGEGEEATV